MKLDDRFDDRASEIFHLVAFYAENALYVCPAKGKIQRFHHNLEGRLSLTTASTLPTSIRIVLPRDQSRVPDSVDQLIKPADGT